MHLEVKPKLKGRQHLGEKHISLRGKRGHYGLNLYWPYYKVCYSHLFIEKRALEKCKEFLGQIKITCYGQIPESHKNKSQEDASFAKMNSILYSFLPEINNQTNNTNSQKRICKVKYWPYPEIQKIYYKTIRNPIN